jgi:hypothetical protein
MSDREKSDEGRHGSVTEDDRMAELLHYLHHRAKDIRAEFNASSPECFGILFKTLLGSVLVSRANYFETGGPRLLEMARYFPPLAWGWTFLLLALGQIVFLFIGSGGYTTDGVRNPFARSKGALLVLSSGRVLFLFLSSWLDAFIAYLLTDRDFQWSMGTAFFVGKFALSLTAMFLLVPVHYNDMKGWLKEVNRRRAIRIAREGSGGSAPV